MKPYRTSFLSVAALVVLLCSLVFTTQANADCGFVLSSNDATWSFSANAGSTQSRTLYIVNTSGVTLTLKLGITSSDAFGINHDGLTIGPGDTASVIITFKPGSTAHGTITSSLVIQKQNTDCHQTLGLSGTVTGVTNSDAALVADPHEFNFGSVAVGTSACKKVTITNTSKDAVMNLSNAKISCDGGDFTVSGWNSATLAPGASVTIEICFKPHAAGLNLNCNWSVKYTTSTGDGTLTVSFSGNSPADNTTGGDAILVADPHEFAFIGVDAGTTVCKDVVVTNKSKSTVIITNWSKCDNADFTITPGDVTQDTLASGASMTFTICYKPHESGLSAKCALTVRYLQIDPAKDGSIVINFSGTSAAPNTGHDKVCLHSEQGANNMDAVVVGGSAEHTLYLINNSNFAITVAKADISGDYAKYFAISSQLPITVPAHTTSTTLAYTFSPTASTPLAVKGIVTFGLTGDSLQCPSTTGVLVGIVVHSNTTTDSVVRPLFPNEPRTLGIEGSANRVASTSFYFTNNLGVDATVNKVYLQDGTFFTISSMTPSPTPFVLHPGGNLTVVVTYTAIDKAVHHDKLMIEADHMLQATSFDIQGVNSAAAVVAGTLPNGVAINVSPNPASSFVTVNMAGVKSADLQVYDLLGKAITSSKLSTTWRWDASNIVAGSYIVRIAGESLTGEQFVASKRIIVSR